MTTAKLNIRRMQKGFTLIELLIVIGILAVLMGIVLVAINPAKQFRATNDTKRSADVNTILNAIGQYEIDNKGALPKDVNGVTIDATVREIAAGTGVPTPGGSAVASIDLCSLLAPKYVASLPTDPLSALGGAQVPSANCTNVDPTKINYDTGYQVSATTAVNSSRVTVYAPAAEGGVAISVTR